MSTDNKTKRFYTGKVTTLIFSVVVAIAIWLVAVYVDDPSITVTAKNVPVRFLNEDVLNDNGLIIREKENVPKYNLRISGRRSDLVEYMNRITIDIDVSDISSTGTHKLNGVVNIPSVYIALERGMNSTIPIEVSSLAQKTIKLYTKQAGTNKEYIIKSEPKNPEVIIKGAKEEIDLITYAMTDINITDITHDCDIIGDIYYCDSNNDKLSNISSVYSNVMGVSVKNTIYPKKVVPVVAVLSDELSKEYVFDTKESSISPSQIEIGVPNGTDIDFAEIVITSNTPNQYKATTDVEGVYIPYNNSIINVKPVLLKRTTKTLNVHLKAINTPSGMNAQFEAMQTLTVDCGEDVTVENINATVDLKNATKGNNSIKITLEGDNIFSYEEKYIDVVLE